MLGVLLMFKATILVPALLGDLPSTSRLAVIQPAPNFCLVDEVGNKLSHEDLNGKVWLVSFVFTTCTGTCPETTLRMSLVQRELGKRDLLKGGQVRLLSITLDPERDRPEVLGEYAKRYGADSKVWSFLTGKPAQVARVIADWGMWARPGLGGQLDHPSRIFLVDRQGQVREIYNLAFLRPRWVVDDIEVLLGEAAGTK
jgi:protein SCO1/2